MSNESYWSYSIIFMLICYAACKKDMIFAITSHIDLHVKLSMKLLADTFPQAKIC